MLEYISRSAIIRLCKGVSILSIILFMNSSFFSIVVIAHAEIVHTMHTSESCPIPSDPTGRSLLVVLLDRSGSLTAQPGATDPQGYSTSVTKALADLWPGEMAVIPFSNGATSVLGPSNLSDPQQQASLKKQVEDYPIGGDTPLAPAVHAALNLLHQQQSPAGSRVIVITDGNPTGSGNNDGPHQEQDIRQNLLPQFCQQGIPFSSFGLTIASTTPDGQDANRLLSDIANHTGASYINVKGPEDLSREIIKLYAQWQHLTFTQVQPGQGGNYPLAIDSFARRVSIVSFRSDANFTIKLVGPDGQTVKQGVLSSSDRHYTINNLTIAGVVTAGTYIVNVAGDTDSQVYALVDSPLKLQLLQPTSTTLARAGQSVNVQAQFIDDNGSITPEAKAAQVLAKITLVVDGHPVNTNTIVLSQQKTATGTLTPIFSGGTLVYRQAGTLQIEMLGSYQQAQRQTSIELQLLQPAPPPPISHPIDRKPLLIGILSTLGALIVVALLILFIILWRRSQPKPYGYITNGKRGGEVNLEDFSKSIIHSRDLEVRGSFTFPSDFELVFTKEKEVKIKTLASNITVEVKGRTTEKVTPEGVLLDPGRKIYIDGRKMASFETSSGKLW